MESVRNKLGPLIKQKRKLLGMTQEDLAERLNISISFAGQIERGEAMPSVEMLQLIITELDLDPRALFFDEKVEVNEYTELCLIMRRMSTQQRKLVLAFARIPISKHFERNSGQTSTGLFRAASQKRTCKF